MKDCGIVKDLLPLVAEDMASEESTAFVKEHIERCADCKAALDAMKAPVEAEPAAPLKTVRKAVKKRGWLIAGLIACLVAALIFGAFARLTKPIPVSSSDEAFDTVEVKRKRVEIVDGAELHLRNVVVASPVPSKDASSETALPASTTPGPADPDTEMVKLAQEVILVVINSDSEYEDTLYILSPGEQYALSDLVDTAPDAQATPGPRDEQTDPKAPTATSLPYNSITFSVVLAQPKDTADGFSVPDTALQNAETDEPEILGVPQRLLLTADPSVEEITVDRTGGEVFVGAYTTLWRKWLNRDSEPAQTQIGLSDVDAVFFEPYDNTDHEVLYVRGGYTPEAGFALPRLVLNYYFLMALAGTAILALVWFVLRLTKKEKASRVFGVLLLIAGSFVFAFLAAGFPATTIAPARELAFVLVIALLLIGAGLCGRKLLRKE